MATINVNWSRLSEQGIEPQAITKLVQSWEKAGFRVYGTAQDAKDLVVLQKMTAPEQPKSQTNTYQLAFYFVLGVLASLIVVFAGWVTLTR
jgi:hypothetical protein